MICCEVIAVRYDSIRYQSGQDSRQGVAELINGKVTIPLNEISPGSPNVYVYQASLVMVPAPPDEPWQVLDRIYYNNDTRLFTTNRFGNTFAGHAVIKKPSDKLKGLIHLGSPNHAE